MQKEEEEASSETQSTQSGRENWREEHWRKSPWVLTLTRPFPKPKANAGSWLGTKNALFRPIGEQHMLSSFRVFVHDGY